MTPKLQRLFDVLGRESLLPKERLGEITIEVPAAEYLQVCRKLRDHPDLRFDPEFARLSGEVSHALRGAHT